MRRLCTYVHGLFSYKLCMERYVRMAAHINLEFDNNFFCIALDRGKFEIINIAAVDPVRSQ